jgi:4-amino-4-deoxy-L-arabinose transferase-like glycosyltransferase
VRPRTFKLAFAAILLVALAVRVVAAVDANSAAPVSDALDFDRHGVAIAEGDGFPEALPVVGGPGPSAFCPPLYPGLLGGVYTLSGTGDDSERWLYGRLAQAVIGTAIVALIGLIALRVWGRRPALIAAAIAAAYPPLILAGTSLLTEPLFTALVLAGVLALLEYRLGDRQARWLLVAGACAGLAGLTRGNGLAVIAALALGAWVVRPRLSLRSLAAPAAVVAAGVLVIAPWTLRNAFVLDAFVPVTTQSGTALAGQYNDAAKDNDWGWVGPWGLPQYRSLFDGEPVGEVEVNRQFTDGAVDYIADHPGALAAAALRNTLRVFSVDNPVELERSSAAVLGKPRDLAQASVYAFWVLAPLALAGAFSPLARRMPGFVWAILPILLASVVFVGGNARYREPLEPILILLAAAAVAWASGRLTAKANTEWPNGNETRRSSGSSAAKTL